MSRLISRQCDGGALNFWLDITDQLLEPDHGAMLLALLPGALYKLGKAGLSSNGDNIFAAS